MLCSLMYRCHSCQKLGYSIFTPHRGMEVKFQGVLQKEFLGFLEILKYAFLGVTNILTNIFSGLMHLHKDLQGDCRNYPIFTFMLSIISKGVLSSNCYFCGGGR